MSARLSAPMYDMLRVLDEQGPTWTGALRSNVLHALYRRGLVGMGKHPVDPTATAVSLTEKGRRAALFERDKKRRTA